MGKDEHLFILSILSIGLVVIGLCGTIIYSKIQQQYKNRHDALLSCPLLSLLQVVQTLAIALFLATGTLFFLVFPPMIFSYVEGWSYGEGFYFTFITLSTIGFGDYVVGNEGVGLGELHEPMFFHHCSLE